MSESIHRKQIRTGMESGPLSYAMTIPGAHRFPNAKLAASLSHLSWTAGAGARLLTIHRRSEPATAPPSRSDRLCKMTVHNANDLALLNLRTLKIPKKILGGGAASKTFFQF